VAWAHQVEIAMSKTIGLYVLLCILTGCCATTDPRQGGLFCYNPKAYEKRLEERRQTLTALEKNAAEQSRLEREAEEKRQVLAEQKKQLIALGTELTDVYQRIATYQAQNQEQAAEKARLERNIDQAKAQLRALQKEGDIGSEGVEEKQAKIRRLRADMENLLHLMNKLSESAR